MSDSMLLLFPLNEWFSFFSVHLNQLMYLKIYRCLGHAIRNSDYLRPGCGIFKEAWVTNVHQKMNKEDVLLIYTHNGILLGPKKKSNNVICSNMDEPRDYNTKWSKSDRETQILYDYHSYIEPQIWYKWTYSQNKQTHRQKHKLGVWD